MKFFFIIFLLLPAVVQGRSQPAIEIPASHIINEARDNHTLWFLNTRLQTASPDAIHFDNTDVQRLKKLMSKRVGTPKDMRKSLENGDEANSHTLDWISYDTHLKTFTSLLFIYHRHWGVGFFDLDIDQLFEDLKFCTSFGNCLNLLSVLSQAAPYFPGQVIEFVTRNQNHIATIDLNSHLILGFRLLSLKLHLYQQAGLHLRNSFDGIKKIMGTEDWQTLIAPWIDESEDTLNRIFPEQFEQLKWEWDETPTQDLFHQALIDSSVDSKKISPEKIHSLSRDLFDSSLVTLRELGQQLAVTLIYGKRLRNRDFRSWLPSLKQDASHFSQILQTDPDVLQFTLFSQFQIIEFSLSLRHQWHEEAQKVFHRLIEKNEHKSEAVIPQQSLDQAMGEMAALLIRVENSYRDFILTQGFPVRMDGLTRGELSEWEQLLFLGLPERGISHESIGFFNLQEWIEAGQVHSMNIQEISLRVEKMSEQKRSRNRFSEEVSKKRFPRHSRRGTSLLGTKSLSNHNGFILYRVFTRAFSSQQS